MVVGTLPWSSIQTEVRKATRAYMLANYGKIIPYVNTRDLATFIQRSNGKYPHLSGLGWDDIKNRSGAAMKKMGWEKHRVCIYKVGK